MRDWTLHHEPYRHYKALNPSTGKVTWNGAHKQRIVSVTDVLDGGADALLSWAVGNALVAAETAVVEALPGAAATLAELHRVTEGAVDFAWMAQATGKMPDTVRDDKAALGTLAHEYLADHLMAVSAGALARPQRNYSAVPYGYRLAIDNWYYAELPVVFCDTKGYRIERTVGDFERAVAGTYDAQVLMTDGVHRLDLKTSRTVQPKHFAQVAAYEELAQACGEDPSDYVTVLHADPLNGCKMHSLAVGSTEYLRARAVFGAYLTIKRGEAALGKLLKPAEHAELVG